MMRYLGLAVSSMQFLRTLPPKIARIVLMDMCGLPVTDYLIIDLHHVSSKSVYRALELELNYSPCGVVVRTVTSSDAKCQPYYWLRTSVDVPRVFSVAGRYIVAFAPRAVPERAHGFTVGRWLVTADGRNVVEYCQNQIQPRTLERLTFSELDRSENGYGVMVQEPGHFFRSCYPGNGVAPAVAPAIVRELHRWRESVDLLLKALPGHNICLEFTCSGGAIEFHDFDQ